LAVRQDATGGAAAAVVPAGSDALGGGPPEASGARARYLVCER
jgi:hypothetical protein